MVLNDKRGEKKKKCQQDTEKAAKKRLNQYLNRMEPASNNDNIFKHL